MTLRPPANLLLLALADLTAWLAALALAHLLASADHHTLPQLLHQLWPSTALLLACSATLGLYNTPWLRTRPELDAINEIRAQYLASGASLLATLATLALTHQADHAPRAVILLAHALLPSCLIAARHLARKLARLPKKALVIHGDIAVSDDLLPRHGLPYPMPRALKTCAEGLLAVLLLLLCLPLACLLALLVKLTSPGPILYVATRLGQHARPFRLLKFRTMRPDADRQLPHLLASSPDAAREWSQNVKLSHDPRITPLGRLLRKTSLDELPQLLNVIRGDMAIIGPRPIVEAERPRYASNFPTLVSVKPGLTGLWQVSGRNDLTYSQRVALDIWYIEHWSIWLDLYILHKTLPEILSLHGR